MTAMAQLATGRPPDAEATWERLQGVSAAGADFAAHGRADLAVYEGRLSDAAAHPRGGDCQAARGALGEHHRTADPTLAKIRALQGRGRRAQARGAGARNTKASRASCCSPAASDYPASRSVRAGRPTRQEGRQGLKCTEGSRGRSGDEASDARAAVASFEAAQKLADSWLGRYGLGRAYLEAGVFVEAQTQFDTCLTRGRVRRRPWCWTTSPPTA